MAGEQDVTEGLLDWLRGRGDCVLDPGLSTGELARAERAAGLTVPPGWRAVLIRAHPVSLPGSAARYPDWRVPESGVTRELLDAPVEGVLFDVSENGFWWHSWGTAPEEAAKRLALARRRLAEVPRLTPLGGHLYVGPTDESPVFSIVQADLHIPAVSLAELAALAAHPRARRRHDLPQHDLPEHDYPIGGVGFWSELHAYSQLGHSNPRFGRLARGGL